MAYSVSKGEPCTNNSVGRRIKMKRDETGRYLISKYQSETVRAFIPNPLPPAPPLDMSGELQQALENATLALGRLDGIATLLPDKTLFLYYYVRKEAVLSSQIEGTQSSFSDLLMYEMDAAPFPLDNDVIEVSNYVAALQLGLERISEGFPLSNRLIRDIHRILLSSGRGSAMSPGEFRRSQNWIGGTRPGNAAFVPPPHDELQDCMGALERFLHARDDGLPILVRTALAHAQFETIHPFLDGNGRIGRLLITFLLCQAGVMREPLLYMSLYLKRHKNRYYDLLNYVREAGDWEEWTLFFLEGIHVAASAGFDTSLRLMNLFERDRAKIAKFNQRASSALRVHEALKKEPIASRLSISKLTGLSLPTVSSSIDLLVESGIAREIPSARRARLFAYYEYLSILSDGTELT